MIVAIVSATLGLSTTPANATPPMPQVIPSLTGWENGRGAYAVGSNLTVRSNDSELTETAELLADEVDTLVSGDAGVSSGKARGGDIALDIDHSRTDLGAEGYELRIDRHIEVIAATRAGAFYGSRTVLQMLSQQDRLPRGQVTDIPKYAERGVTLCACVIHISTNWIDRLLEEMSYLKLNTLVLEMKVKVDSHPETNTWSYYTKEQVAEIVAKAKAHNIEVIPLINTPGHMEIWLDSKPELALKSKTGAVDNKRLDITTDAAYDFYTDLIDEYAEVFGNSEWHMGVDEYMLGSGYANYPQMLEFARKNIHPNATEDDLVAWYVNKVHDYVKSKGMTMRIWNDGVIEDNQYVDFDTDITVDFWWTAASTVQPQQFIDWGHKIVNDSTALYMVRGSYGVDARAHYTNGWNPKVFSTQTVDAGPETIGGARMSLWPDGGTPKEAELVTEQRMFEGLRFTAQTTWSDTRPWQTYDGFLAAMNTVGRPPLWENIDRKPIADGKYSVAADGAHLISDGTSGVTTGSQPEAFTFTHDGVGYYSIKNAQGRCLDVARTGHIGLGVPLDVGAAMQFSSCSSTTIQKWQLLVSDGDDFRLVNAATQQSVVIADGMVNIPLSGAKTATIADGKVVQSPADVVTTDWSVTPR